MQTHIPTPPIADLHLGGLTLHIYALCILNGVVVATLVTIWRVRGLRALYSFRSFAGVPRESTPHTSEPAQSAPPSEIGAPASPNTTLTPSQILDILIASFPCALIGARLYYVITVPEQYLAHPENIVKVWEGGLGIMGGLIFGISAAFIYCKIKGISFATLAWCACPAIPLAQALGRLGNWFNGELYGVPTDLPWGLDISRGKYEATIFYHPTFLYEILWGVAIFAALMCIFTPKRFEKLSQTLIIIPTYLCLYTFGRFFIELLRVDTSEYILGLRVNNWFALGLFALALAWGVRCVSRIMANYDKNSTPTQNVI